MRTMSGLDGAFLHIETPDTPMHVGALYLLKRQPDAEESYFDAVERLLMPRLAMSPFFRARLARTPFNLANPLWDEHRLPNPAYHLRQVILPRPGSFEQLQDKVAELHAQLLDRSQPLWELTVIDGLADGNVAIYMKVHHAALDGASGVTLANALFDSSSTPRPIPDNWREQAASSQRVGLIDRIGLVAQQTSDQYARMMRGIPDLLHVAGGLVKHSQTSKGQPPGTPKNLSFGPKTPLNVPITAERGFAAVTLPLAGVKQIATLQNAKLNDVVLALCSGALRAYLRQHRCLPDKSLIATMPVSLREADDQRTTTQATLTLVNLATHLADPLERLTAIRKASSAAKSFTHQAKSVTPTDFPSLGVPWLLSGLAALYGASRISRLVPPIANLLISNVPGPRQPLYVAGAEILSYWPLSIVEHGLGLNVTVMSYCDSLDIGLTVARKAVPDVHLLAQMLNHAYEELLQSANATVAEPVTPDPNDSQNVKKRTARTSKTHPTTPEPH